MATSLRGTSEFSADRLAEQVLTIQDQNRRTVRLDGWFLTQEIRMRALQRLREAEPGLPNVVVQAKLFAAVCEELPLSIRAGEVFAGTQDDAFARTYALINPEFRVETFAGYCDPMAVYGDITPDPELGFTEERIKSVRDFWAAEPFAAELAKPYAAAGDELAEVAYFVEQVTGHTVADFRPAMSGGLTPAIERARASATESTGKRRDFFTAAVIAMEAVLRLGDRYAELASRMAREEAGPVRRAELERIAAVAGSVLRRGAETFHEAIQAFILLWMGMALEQAPNPYAFSVGNLDRILQPYYEKDDLPRDVAVQLVRHLLALFNVADRNWAISQNIMVGGRDEAGRDLTCDMTTIVLDAFYRSNYPQPALSLKLHSGTPESVYSALEPFFTTAGSSTPSFFNDDALLPILESKGIAPEDTPLYSIAGCQEPVIMGQESANTTNSWLNLAKVLELAIHGGKSAISGKPIGLSYEALGLDPRHPLKDAEALKAAFWKQLDHFLPRMQDAANGCTKALSLLPVPFLSTMMGGLESGVDLRDVSEQGTKYNASGCLIHGLSVVTDSLAAVEHLQKTAPELLDDLPSALLADFKGYETLRARCVAAPKYGNHIEDVDRLAAEIADRVSERVNALRNPWGNPFLPDWSSPSTHLLYGYWVGATPDGREARRMLGYGVDPTAGMATHGLPPRILSMNTLRHESFVGGYASHIGLEPGMIMAAAEDRGFVTALREFVLNPLFGLDSKGASGGYYVYLNVDSAKRLRKILANPKELVPSGIYIMRIHGTFVNFLDLSPAIQEDIITRLDEQSTRISAGRRG